MPKNNKIDYLIIFTDNMMQVSLLLFGCVSLEKGIHFDNLNEEKHNFQSFMIV
jgi:hypothetical protein